MRIKRAKKNIFKERIRAMLIASILLISLMIFPFTKPLGANAATVSKSSNDDRLYITKTVEPQYKTERTFRVTVTIKNRYAKFSGLFEGDNVLKEVKYTDFINSKFTIVNKPSNAVVMGNTITKDIGNLNKGDSIIVSYTVKAKSDDISGSYLINTNKSNISYKYKKNIFDEDTTSLKISSPTVNVEKVIVSPSDPDVGKVTLNKNVIKTNDGRYRINFDIAGKIQKEDPKKADIILLIDKSNSMLYGSSNEYENNWTKRRITFVKNAATNLVNSIMDDKSINVKGNIRFAVADFNYSAETVEGFNSNKDTINNAINNKISITEDDENGGTNTEAGIRKAGELLGESESTNEDAKRYIVMFTDGLPTAYVNNGQTEEYGKYSPDIVFGNAQEAYNDVIGGITYYGGIGYNGPYGFDDEDYYNPRVVNPPVPDKNRAKFYSVGYKPGNTVKDALDSSRYQAVMMEDFLKTTQNVISQDQFADKYCTNDVSKINSIFDDITNQLKQSLNSIVDNAVLTDIISDEFSIPRNVADTVSVSVNGTQVPDRIMKNGSVVRSVEGQKITFDLSRVPQESDNNGMVRISVSFIVDVKDEYFSGNGIDTNKGKAVLNYDDPKTKEKKAIDVVSPKVNIAPVEGAIYVEKVVNLNGIEKEDKTTNDFPIYISKATDSPTINKNNEARYGFQVTAGSRAVMNVYLKGISTDVTKINNASDLSKNYITAGTYKVSEIVPMDYKEYTVKIKYSEDIPWDKVEPNTNNEFILTKEKPNVYILVTNNLANNTYWRDNAYSHNEFIYTNN